MAVGSLDNFMFNLNRLHAIVTDPSKSLCSHHSSTDLSFCLSAFHHFARVFIYLFSAFFTATSPEAAYWTVFSVKKMPYFSFSSFSTGSHRPHVYGASTPLSEMVPSSTCLTATAHGTPTSFAMAE